MRNFVTYAFWLILTLTNWSCKEVYYPDDIESTERIPVIQGTIHENDVPLVQLSWALRYGDWQTEYISGAEVQVMDDQGNSVYLQETSSGNYTAPSGEYKGVPGRIYTLMVRLPDGHEYVSSPAPLLSQPLIDSLYADPDIREVYSYSAYNEPISEFQEGLHIMADLSCIADSTVYYRFNTEVVKEITYDENPRTLAVKVVYVWETSTLDYVYSVNKTVEYNDWQVLREHPVGFLHFDYNIHLETDKKTAPYPVGWVLIFKVYAVSAEVYDYYNSMALQLNAKDQIFAPVPSQVKSTVHCLTDPEKDVIGVFEASSVTTVYKAFAWKNAEVYQSKVLESFPEDVQDGMIKNFPPEFWVTFD